MMKVLDKVVLAIMVIGLIVLCFMQQCALDKYFLVFGVAVAAMCLIIMILQDKKKDEAEDAKSR